MVEHELLNLVDENDCIIGTVDRAEVYEKDIHNVRVIGVFIVDDEGKILVQKRSKKKFYCPNGYDFSVAGHVRAGESYEDAVQREAHEELGVELSEMKEILYCKYPNEFGLAFFSKYFIAKCPNKKLLVTNEKETSRIEFLSIHEIQKRLIRYPQMFKSDYSPAFNVFCKFVLANNETCE